VVSRSPAPFMNGSTPTAVLVHGAFTDGSSWVRVIAALQAVGVGVAVPALPLRGLASDAGYVASAIERFDCPVILAGHCYGGAVIGAVAARAANVVGLVYVTAFALAEGESCSDVAGRFPDTRFGSSLWPARYRDGAGATAMELYVRPEAFAATLAADLPAAETDVMAVTQRPITVAALDEKAAPAATALPTRYVVATADQAIHPDAQRFMAGRAGAETVEVDASHAVALSRPAAVAEQILNVAVATRA